MTTPPPPSRPPNVTSASPNNRFTPISPARLLAWGELMLELIIAQVAMALGDVSVLGVHPLAFLKTWGQNLEKQASDAYIKATTADATANNAQTSADAANTKSNGILDMLVGFTSGIPLLSQLIGIFPGVTGGLSGLGGLGSIFTDILGVIGSPLSLGSGTPLIGGISSIPLLGGFFSGTGGGGLTLLSSFIPGLDASKIITGVFSPAITGLQTIISALPGVSDITSLAASLLGTLNLSNGTASNIFAAWFNTTPGTPSAAAVNTAVGNMRTIVVDGYTLQTFGASTYWTIPPYTEMWWGVIGAGHKGTDGTAANTPSYSLQEGGIGGEHGGYTTQKMPAGLDGETATITVGSYYPTGGVSSIYSPSAGTIQSLPGVGQAISASSALSAASTPGAGGDGGDAQVLCKAYRGRPGDNAARAYGGDYGQGYTTTSSAVWAGTDGGQGQDGQTTSLPVSGGAGGGGGGGATATAIGSNATGGNGGAGGFPGGGGGAGGGASAATPTPGAGAYGANGFVWVIYK